MSAIPYARAGSLAEALELLARHGPDAVLMAGGTSLVLLLREGLLAPPVVIGLHGAGELRGSRALPDGGLTIGALTALRAIERDERVRSGWPALADAIGRVASVRVRNQATLGGNLAHADPAQDPPPMLLALDATAEIAGPAGGRTVPLAAFFRDVFETVLAPDEVLTAIHLPPPAPGDRAVYVKFLPRTVDDYATVSVAVRLRLTDDGRIVEARVALGGVAAVPLRAGALEAALIGLPAGSPALEEAAELVDAVLDPVDDARGSAAYKREMARVWTARALRSLVPAAGAARG